MKTFLKILLTLIYLYLIPNLISHLPFILIPFRLSGGRPLGIFLVLAMTIFVFVAYKLISLIIEGVFLKKIQKIITGVVFLALISLPVIFLLKDLG